MAIARRASSFLARCRRGDLQSREHVPGNDLPGGVDRAECSWCAQRESIRSNRSGNIGHCDVVNVASMCHMFLSYSLFGSPGRQTYAFPEDCSLEPGAEVHVRSGPRRSKAVQDEGATLVWTQRRVWNNNGDAAMLLRPDGTEVARCSAEIRCASA